MIEAILTSAMLLTRLSVTGLALSQPVFHRIDPFPGGAMSVAISISGDGTVVVGHADRPEGLRAFKWTELTGVVQLGSSPATSSSTAFAASEDGLWIAGSAFIQALGTQAVRWTPSGAAQNLGQLPGGENVRALAISADGSTVVGSADVVGGGRAVRWTSATGLVALDGPVYHSVATGVSADGAVVVGYAGSGPMFPFRWTLEGGTAFLEIPQGFVGGLAYAVNPTGNVVVGNLRSVANVDRAFRWTAAAGMQDLGVLPGDSNSTAFGTSADGKTIVGLSSRTGLSRAFLWTESGGMVDLNAHIASLGIDLSAWHLVDATGVSADGRSIVGNGRFDGALRAWYFSFSSACAGDIATEGNPWVGPDGFISGVDFDFFVLAFFQGLRRSYNSGRLVADIADSAGQLQPDGFLTGTDFDLFVLLYFQGC